jgi:hypothetical protein
MWDSSVVVVVAAVVVAAVVGGGVEQKRWRMKDHTDGWLLLYA